MCTSSIKENGVKLELGRHDEVWDDMYSDTFKSSIAESIHSEMSILLFNYYYIISSLN